MQFSELPLTLVRLPAPLPIWRATCNANTWSETAQKIAVADGRLISVWGNDQTHQAVPSFSISAAYATEEGLLWIDLPLSVEAPIYPSLVEWFLCADRMQRATFDLLGIIPQGAPDNRPWYRHGAWPEDYFPLRRVHSGQEVFDTLLEDYPFVRVEGDGVHEIAVGPVHAGIIEPGHFRFSVVGEKILRLEQRLGYKHKGIEKRFEQFSPKDAYRLAGRVSGDSTVAFAWAYCMALESICETEVPKRAAWLRALMLERERVANHLGDLGFLGNDVAFSFGLAQFMCLKEDWLRLNKQFFGHRFMMDQIIPGGVAKDLPPNDLSQIAAQCTAIESEVMRLRSIYDDHAGLQDRFITTGRLRPPLAQQLGLTGLAGRASNVRHDLRCDYPMLPFDQLNVRIASHKRGDVAARAFVRFEELLESLRLLRQIAQHIPTGTVHTDIGAPSNHYGVGWVEGWRGEVFVALHCEGDRIRRCHCHDPSWQNWPTLEHAVIGDIVPDFPLINKSFNLSYSGHDG